MTPFHGTDRMIISGIAELGIECDRGVGRDERPFVRASVEWRDGSNDRVYDGIDEGDILVQVDLRG